MSFAKMGTREQMQAAMAAERAKFHAEQAARTKPVTTVDWAEIEEPSRLQHLRHEAARAKAIGLSPVAAVMRHRKSPRRMVQQRRAAHARARWPWKLQTQWAWTDAEAYLIDALLYLGGETGTFQAYRAELENRAGIRPSTQRAAEAKLQELGLLEVTENRRSYARNEANTYKLNGVLKETARMLWLRGGTKLSGPSGGVVKQTSHTSHTSTPEKAKRTPDRRPPDALRAPTSPQSGEVCTLLGRDEKAGPSRSRRPAQEQAEAEQIDEDLALDLARTFLPEIAPAEIEAVSAAAADAADKVAEIEHTFSSAMEAAANAGEKVGGMFVPERMALADARSNLLEARSHLDRVTRTAAEAARRLDTLAVDIDGWRHRFDKAETALRDGEHIPEVEHRNPPKIDGKMVY